MVACVNRKWMVLVHGSSCDCPCGCIDPGGRREATQLTGLRFFSHDPTARYETQLRNALYSSEDRTPREERTLRTAKKGNGCFAQKPRKPEHSPERDGAGIRFATLTTCAPHCACFFTLEPFCAQRVPRSSREGMQASRPASAWSGCAAANAHPPPHLRRHCC